MKKSKLWLSLTVGASVFFSSQIAWADPSSGGNTSADVAAKPIGHLVDVEKGELQLKGKDAEFKLGTGKSNDTDARLVSGSISYKGPKLYGIKSTHHDETNLWFVVDPSLHLRVDAAPGKSGEGPQIKKVDAEVGRFKVNSFTPYDPTDKDSKHMALGEFSFPMVPNISGTYQDNKFNDTKSVGALISSLDPSVKFAFKVEGRQVEICAAGRPALALGQTKIGANKDTAAFRLDLKNCASVELGAIGKLGYEINYQLLHNGPGTAHTVEQSVSIRNIAKSPIFVEYTNTLDQSFSKDAADNSVAKGAVTNMVYIGAAAK